MNRAYETLTNDIKRQAYDIYRNESEEIIVDESIKPFNAANQDSEDYFINKSQKEEFKRTIFDKFEEFHNFKKKLNIVKGEDIELELTLTLQELVQKEPYEITVNKKIHCEECQGQKVEKGKTEGLTKCYECQGTGYSQDYNLNTKKCPQCNGLSYLYANPCKLVLSLV